MLQKSKGAGRGGSKGHSSKSKGHQRGGKHKKSRSRRRSQGDDSDDDHNERLKADGQGGSGKYGSRRVSAHQSEQQDGDQSEENGKFKRSCLHKKEKKEFERQRSQKDGMTETEAESSIHGGEGSGSQTE